LLLYLRADIQAEALDLVENAILGRDPLAELAAVIRILD
jgi:hypothetical protein